MNKYMQEAKEIRKSIKGLADGASDDKIVDNKAAFPFWNPDGVDYVADDILQFETEVYRVVQPHKSQPDWAPNLVPALFTVINAGEDWKEWKPGNSYAKGAKRTHNGKKWISNVDNNIWQPGATGVYTWDEVTTED